MNGFDLMDMAIAFCTGGFVCGALVAAWYAVRLRVGMKQVGNVRAFRIWSDS